jgi:hypothetical protein
MIETLKPEIVDTVLTVNDDGTVLIDEKLAKELWLESFPYTRIFVDDTVEFPLSFIYNEYKAWNRIAMYANYNQEKKQPIMGMYYIFIYTNSVILADNIRAKITNPDLFFNEWKRWMLEHADFIERLGVYRSIPIINAFNAHISNILNKEEQDG